MGHNKSCPKADFRWSDYRKALRKLSPAQETALSAGVLRPLLDYVHEHPDVRFDIRPGKANLYFDGGSLLRLEGAAATRFRGVFDLGYVGESGLIKYDMTTADGVKKVVDDFETRREQMYEHRHAGNGRDERRYSQHIARANDARSAEYDGDFAIYDIEYSYARRCFDFLLFDRRELPEPRLIFGELKCRPGALNGSAGLREHGIDFGEYLVAESGRHVDISRLELADMIRQKQRLELVDPLMPFAGFSSAPPLFMLIFADYDVRKRQLETPLERLRDEVAKRLGDTSLLRFADFPAADDGVTDLLRLRPEHVMTSDQFDAHRARTA